MHLQLDSIQVAADAAARESDLSNEHNKVRNIIYMH